MNAPRLKRLPRLAQGLIANRGAALAFLASAPFARLHIAT